MFTKRKFNLIFTAAFYVAFLIAAAILFAIMCADMDKANQNDGMSLFLGIGVLAAPGFLFVSVELLSHKRLFRIIFSIIGNVVIFLMGALLALAAFNGSGSGEQLYQTLCVSSVLSSTLSLALYGMISNDPEGEKHPHEFDAIKIFLFAAPFLSYLVAFLSLKFLPLVVVFAIVGTIFIFLASFTMDSRLWGGRIFTALCALAFVIFSIAVGAQPARYDLNYTANPFHMLVFLPALDVVIVGISMFTGYKCDVENDTYLIISRVILLIVQPVILYLTGRIAWWIGLAILGGLVLLLVIFDYEFGEARHKKREVYHSQKTNLDVQIEVEYGLKEYIESNMMGDDSCSVSIYNFGTNSTQIRIQIWYSDRERMRKEVYRDSVKGWVRQFMRGYHYRYEISVKN